MFNQNELTGKEFDRALEELRKDYDRYIVRYKLSNKERQAFEERYTHALTAKMNVTRFLQDEELHLKKLIANAEMKAQKLEAKKEATKKPAPKGFADKLLEEFEERIAEYDSIPMPEGGSVELGKLYGAIEEFDKKYWQEVVSFISKNYSISIGHNLENALLSLSTSGSGETPRGLERYMITLQGLGNKSPDYSKETQEAMKMAAFFLHDTLSVLEKSRYRSPLSPPLEEAYSYLQRVIRDFRLTHLKRSI